MMRTEVEREREREKEECGAGDLVFGGPSASSLGESVDLNHSPHAVGWVCPKSPTKSGGPSWVQVGGGLQGEWSATGVHGPGNVRSIQSCDAAFASGLQRSGCVPCAVAPQQFMVWSLTPMSHEPVWSRTIKKVMCKKCVSSTVAVGIWISTRCVNLVPTKLNQASSIYAAFFYRMERLECNLGGEEAWASHHHLALCTS